MGDVTEGVGKSAENADLEGSTVRELLGEQILLRQRAEAVRAGLVNKATVFLERVQGLMSSNSLVVLDPWDHESPVALTEDGKLVEIYCNSYVGIEEADVKVLRDAGYTFSDRPPVCTFYVPIEQCDQVIGGSVVEVGVAMAADGDASAEVLAAGTGDALKKAAGPTSDIGGLDQERT